MAELCREGLVRHVGLSNPSAEQLERAVRVHPISAVQTEWSMWTPVEPDLLEVANRHGIGIVAWSPLGAGLLTGELTRLEAGDRRSTFPRHTGPNLALNNDRFAPLREMAEAFGITPSTLALAWLLHQHPHVVPIPGSTNPAHISANIAAALVALDPEALGRIDDARGRSRPEGATILSTSQRSSEPR